MDPARYLEWKTGHVSVNALTIDQDQSLHGVWT